MVLFYKYLAILIFLLVMLLIIPEDVITNVPFLLDLRVKVVNFLQNAAEIAEIWTKKALEWVRIIAEFIKNTFNRTEATVSGAVIGKLRSVQETLDKIIRIQEIVKE